MFCTGPALEEQLRTFLEKSCDVFSSGLYDQEYKLDLVVTRFHRVNRFPDSIGLQMTKHRADPDKIEEFGCKVLQFRPTKRAAYLEVDPGFDTEGGGGEFVYAALLCLAFGRAPIGDTLVGLRASNDAYEFFDLREYLQSFPGPHVDWKEPETIPGERLEGEVRRYYPAKKFGHIVTNRRSKPFFLHRTEADQALRDQLDTLRDPLDALRVNSTGCVKNLHIPVVFTDRGTLPGHPLPAACKACLRG